MFVRQLDPRGGRFAAALTSVVLGTALILGQGWGVALIGLQTAVFALGALVGPQAQPYAAVFKRFVRPRLGPPAEFEDAAPARFAQVVGLGFALLALLGGLTGRWLLYDVAAGLALLAALLNAAFGFCLGCEVYLLTRSLRPRMPVRS